MTFAMVVRPSWLEAALQHQRAGRFAEAERLYESVLRTQPGQGDALTLLGLIAAHRGRLDLAAQLIARAVEAQPQRGDFHAALGNVHLAQGLDHEMTRCYRRALCLTRFASIPAAFAELASRAGDEPASFGRWADADSYHSQFLQDVYLDRWVFNGKEGGVFVDIGAHDGVSLSNSCFFERQRGWTGLCVEPNPSVFERLAHNRGCVLAQCCVAKDDTVVPFRKLSGPSEMLSGMVEGYRPGHLARLEGELKQYGGSSELIEIEAQSLNTLCTRHGISAIDYLSIDTEGSEFDILHAADFTALFVHALTVECNYEDDRQRLEPLLDRHGFDLAMTLGHDLLFLNRKSPWHAEHAAGAGLVPARAQRLVR